MSFVPIGSFLKCCEMRATRAAKNCLRAALWLITAGMPMAAFPADSPPPAEMPSAARPVLSFETIAAEALRSNAEIQAALKEKQAAQHRIAPAGALDDPMLEAGVLNLPTDTLRLDREDMTMKMIGLSQRFPYSGKRELRRNVAAREAESVGHGFRETVNRVLREIKIAYYDLALTVETQRLTEKNRAVLGQLLKVTESRYAVGQSTQADVLKSQTQFTKMLDELLRLDRERAMTEAEIGRLLARHGNYSSVLPALPAPDEAPASSKQGSRLRDAHVRESGAAPSSAGVASVFGVTSPKGAPVPPSDGAPLVLEDLEKTAQQRRPQLLALQSIIARNERALDLARTGSLPDFDVKFAYGQRDNALTGMKRADLVTLTVAMNLPVWREAKTEPRIAEAQAMRGQALDLLRAQQHDVRAKLHHQIVASQQYLKSLRLYERDILPAARLTLEAALAAYRVNRVDFLTLLDNQMSVFNFEIASAGALVGYHKALAELEFLTGKLADDALGPVENAGDKP